MASDEDRSSSRGLEGGGLLARGFSRNGAQFLAGSMEEDTLPFFWRRFPRRMWKVGYPTDVVPN